MKCQWCDKEYPHKKGKHCGWCKRPEKKETPTMTTEDATRCPSCGVLYVTHPGLIPTCRELMDARAEVVKFKEEVVRLCLIYNKMENDNKDAAAEVLRLREENDRLSHYESLVIEIGNFAHDISTGPAIPDDLWEVRRMAYEL
jgi:hypothetical protein